MKSLIQLKKRLQQLEVDIQEVKQRLPAHSTKPAMMAELMELEDERDALVAQIHQLQKQA